MFAILLIGFLAVTQSASCGPDQTERVWSELICENCKCNNVKGRKSGEDVNSRDECEDLAFAAGAKYYNFMVDGPFVKICAYSPSTEEADKSMSTDAACSDATREWKGGEPHRDENGRRDEQQDRDDKITKSHWKIFIVKDECKHNTCAVSLDTIHETDPKHKCTGLDHIQFRDSPNTEPSLLECGQAAHDAGFDYFSYRKDKKYCYYGDQHSSPYHCTGDMKVETKSPEWSIYSVDCANPPMLAPTGGPPPQGA